jgi:signal transduction histidine kinase
MKQFFYLIFILSLLALLKPNQALAAKYGNSWQEVQKNKHGEITVYYRDTEPFIIINDQNELSGIEYELLEDFAIFIKQYYGYDLKVNWERKDRFALVYDAIKSQKQNGTFGVSIISNTEERQKEVKFSPSYMHDISVLVSSVNIKTVNNISEYNEVFDGMSAITILETTYEEQLNLIRNKYETNFPVIYVENTDNVLKTISSNDNFFGYLDLPNYLIALNNQTKIKRHNVFSFNNIGYGIIYSTNSDWDEPIRAYFNNPNFEVFIKTTIEKYLGMELYDLMESITNNNNDESLILLTREKELQDIELSKTELILREQRAIRNLFIIAFIATAFIIFILFRLYREKDKSNKILNSQRVEIEKQRGKLEVNNSELTKLNNEKNNLIGILSHDLRAPANNIQGLTSMFQMENKELPETQINLLGKIKSEAFRLNLMIEKILDIRKIDRHEINIKFEKLDLGSITNAVIESFNEKAKAKNINLILNQVNSNLNISADEIYLKQVIENLMSNALKFSNKESSIHITIREDNKKAILEIRDEGPGISKDDMKIMFGKFQRLTAKPTAGENSTGLGLSIVKKYMNEMNGSVRCESELDKGTKFFIEFDKY